jgi:hypothetical protein
MTFDTSETPDAGQVPATRRLRPHICVENLWSDAEERRAGQSQGLSWLSPSCLWPEMNAEVSIDGTRALSSFLADEPSCHLPGAAAAA